MKCNSVSFASLLKCFCKTKDKVTRFDCSIEFHSLIKYSKWNRRLGVNEPLFTSLLYIYTVALFLFLNDKMDHAEYTDQISKEIYFPKDFLGLFPGLFWYTRFKEFNNGGL